jgi:hypothetical protein
MTLDDLLQAPLLAEGLTSEQLDEITKPFWPTTRPELATKEAPVRNKKSIEAKLQDSDLQAQKQLAMQLAAAHGIKLKL